MAGQLWVATLYISNHTAQKITQKHGIQPEEVRDAVQCVTGLQYVWDHHPERGVRALVKTRIRNRKTLVVLYPRTTTSGHGYNLGSAYFIT